MPGTPNPLSDMASIERHVPLSELRPDRSFTDDVLPGFQRAVRARHSIRVFDGEPVPPDVMHDCLSDAILSPSSSNLQTYELYWLKDKAKKRAMAGYCLGQPAGNTAGDFIVVVSRVDLWRRNLDQLIAIMTDNGKHPLPGPVQEYYHSIVPMMMRTDPFGISNFLRRVVFWYKGLRGPIVRTPVNRADHRIYGHVQAALAAQTLMLSLAAHGYESCPLGGIDQRSIARMLDLPPEAEVVMVIAAGTGKPEGLFSARIRLPFGHLVKQV